jgi:HAMP domain-containing protein
MNAADIALIALAVVIAGALIGTGLMVAASWIAEPLHRIAKALTPEDETDPTDWLPKIPKL